MGYSRPKKIYISDVNIVTKSVNVAEKSAEVMYNVDISSHSNNFQCTIQVENHSGEKIAEFNSCEETMNLKDVNFWWPYLMDPKPGYMYTLVIWVHSVTDGDDVYRLPFGIRKISWNATNLLVNGRIVYLRGFGRHEDSDIRGKGLDLPLVARDFELIKWMGANSFRTSHYPYAEEIMDFADRNGIMIIDECPGVNLHIFDNELLKNHKNVMKELVNRDKNRPSVIAWSIANEPGSEVPEALDYFKTVADFTRSLDKTRPVMAVLSRGYSKDNAAPALEIIGINRYFSWYEDTGDLGTVQQALVSDLVNWREKYPNKPVMVTEYGADTISGYHNLPSFIWTEDYQTDLIDQHAQAFDQFRREKNGFIGEMIWNFADFMTQQQITRVVGNKKGIFTRQRQPKASAKELRKRYWKLAKEIDQYQCPNQNL